VSTNVHALEVRSSSAIMRFVDRHPVGLTLAAFGVGYVVAGALFSAATARMAGLGLRVAAAGAFRTAFGTHTSFVPVGPVGPIKGSTHAWERESR
jgi:hypothetical protein